MAGGAIYPDLEGRTVLITGGGSGIGAAIVRAFARQKSKVGFIDIADAPARALADELGRGGATVRYVHADVTDIDALRGAIADIRAAFGPIGVLVNNAAHDDRHATETVTPDYFDGRIAVNLKHQFSAAPADRPDMKAAGGGAIVNYSSISWMTGQGGMAIYTAAKSAIVGLTRSLARDYGKFGIRCNAISPGWVRTERQETLWITPESETRQMELQCLKRWLVPADLAKFTVFLASEEAAACTSQLYVVDGGRV
jgi:NAD(P)-dependent dehydrogenase (short-subunit alcohol dehydrogenase family)